MTVPRYDRFQEDAEGFDVDDTAGSVTAGRTTVVAAHDHALPPATPQPNDDVQAAPPMSAPRTIATEPLATQPLATQPTPRRETAPYETTPDRAASPRATPHQPTPHEPTPHGPTPPEFSPEVQAPVDDAAPRDDPPGAFYDPIAAVLAAQGYFVNPQAEPEPEKIYRHTLAQSRRLGLGAHLTPSPAADRGEVAQSGTAAGSRLPAAPGAPDAQPSTLDAQPPASETPPEAAATGSPAERDGQVATAPFPDDPAATSSMSEPGDTRNPDAVPESGTADGSAPAGSTAPPEPERLRLDRAGQAGVPQVPSTRGTPPLPALGATGSERSTGTTETGTGQAPDTTDVAVPTTAPAAGRVTVPLSAGTPGPASEPAEFDTAPTPLPVPVPVPVPDSGAGPDPVPGSAAGPLPGGPSGPPDVPAGPASAGLPDESAQDASAADPDADRLSPPARPADAGATGHTDRRGDRTDLPGPTLDVPRPASDTTDPGAEIQPTGPAAASPGTPDPGRGRTPPQPPAGVGPAASVAISPPTRMPATVAHQTGADPDAGSAMPSEERATGGAPGPPDGPVHREVSAAPRGRVPDPLDGLSGQGPPPISVVLAPGAPGITVPGTPGSPGTALQPGPALAEVPATTWTTPVGSDLGAPHIGPVEEDANRARAAARPRSAAAREPDADGPVGTDPATGHAGVEQLDEPDLDTGVEKLDEPDVDPEGDGDEPFAAGAPAGPRAPASGPDGSSPRGQRVGAEQVPVSAVRIPPDAPATVPPDAPATVPPDAPATVPPTVPPDVPAAVPAHVVSAFDQMTGIDLGHVALRRDTEVDATAGAARARAYTRGGAVHLPADAGPLDSSAAEALLGHELAHVAQQRALADVATTGGEAHRLEVQARAVERTMRGVPEPIPPFDAPTRPAAPDPAPATGAALSWTPATGFTRAPAAAGTPVPTTAVTQYASIDEAPTPDLAPAVPAAALTDPADVLPLLADLRADLRADLQAALQAAGLQDAGEPATVSSVPGWGESAEPVAPTAESPPAVTDAAAAGVEAPGADALDHRLEGAAEHRAGIGAAELARVLTDLAAEMHATFIPIDDEGALDRLAARLYARLSTRLRSDLLVDRERRGLLVDLP